MAERQESLRPWLALHRAPHIGPATFYSLIERFGSPAKVLGAGSAALSAAGLREETVAALQTPDEAAIEADLAWAAQPGAHILTLTDPRYPARLRAIADPPPLLYVYGDPDCLGLPQLAMVGTRNPTPAGRETAQEFARHLGGMGLTITSGLALGIDAASHQGALTGGGYSVAVVGTGLDRVYPARHRELAHEIVQRGALVSEFAPGTPPLAGNFPRRNRIISGLAVGVLVVEAARQSGSLITARLALEQGREVFAVPGSIHNPQARGCHQLLRQGAKLVETAQDVLEELGELVDYQVTADAPSGEQIVVDPKNELDAEYQKVLECIGHEPTSVDTVVERSGLTADAVCSMLLVLELQGFVAATTGGHYCQTC
ncbi:DNA-processing protein DprA [Thiohalophilus sp.]|uniref:DNA-processing protein DprA n=1 Tax=Thiohalophilus sp. TaxID=3028392 RepID=UPI002ACE1BFF|nr:DNA-processing protein DprA [Thiohalophilus sp.]MDZ7661382.1 DNA-processing protein DprA [Thiohalophilus sp.]